MTKLEIPLTERSRKYGYIFWPKVLDGQVEGFFKDATTVNLVFNNAEHGKKNIDWKHRRISIGWRWTRRLPEKVKVFVLTWKDEKTVNVVCR